MIILNDSKIHRELKTLNGWVRLRNEIKKKFGFKDFIQAIVFVPSIALLAECANHHPDIAIRWNKVHLILSTHSEGGITQKDIMLVKKIQSLLK